MQSLSKNMIRNYNSLLTLKTNSQIKYIYFKSSHFVLDKLSSMYLYHTTAINSKFNLIEKLAFFEMFRIFFQFPFFGGIKLYICNFLL
jgi:hypothetical protein